MDSRLRPRDRQLSERVAAVDEETGVSCRDRCDPTQRQLTGLTVTTVERANTHREDDVVRLFAFGQSEMLDRYVSDAHATGGNEVGASGPGLPNRRGGPIDRQDMTAREPRRDRASRRTRAAADLEHARVWAQWERVHDGRQPERQRCRHTSTVHGALLALAGRRLSHCGALVSEQDRAAAEDDEPPGTNGSGPVRSLGPPTTMSVVSRSLASEWQS
jgi:hypothetical protein